MRARLSVLALIALAACGANGAPDPVGPEPRTPVGIDISGTAEIGVVGGNF